MIRLTHKPPGPSSFSVVKEFTAQMKRRGGRQWPVCHGGTLDPFAQGLLLLLVGPATKLFELMHPAPKTYVAQVRWGEETDNGDPTGQVISRGDPRGLTPERIEAAARAFLGWTEQIPPATSAKKIGGEPAYKKVQRGEQVILPPSRVYLHSLRWLEHELPGQSRVELVCKGGFYVRALVRDLGRALGCTAHLEALHRTAIGPWLDPEESSPVELRGPEVLPWARRRLLSDEEVGKLRKGEAIDPNELLSPLWELPAGFPDPAAPVLGIHLGKVAMLLREVEGRLACGLELRGGL